MQKTLESPDLGPHPLTKGLRRFSAYGVWGLQPESGTGKVIAKTSPRSWVDLNRDGKFGRGDAAQEFGVVIAGKLGRGEFAVFGDDAIFQNRFLKDDNLLLGKNLVSWMRRGLSKTDFSYSPKEYRKRKKSRPKHLCFTASGHLDDPSFS